MNRLTLAQAVFASIGAFSAPTAPSGRGTSNGPDALRMRLTRSKYQPHGGKLEAARRLLQIERGVLTLASRGLQ
jgi:hypothetical protein